MMLNLYSQFANADSTISIDWQAQFVFIVKALAIICVDDPFVRERFFSSVGGKDTKFLWELFDTERRLVLDQLSQAVSQAAAQAAVPVADAPKLPSISSELQAIAASKLKIADHRKTAKLIHVSDLHEDIRGRFATCSAAVTALFADVGAEDDEANRAHKEHTLELFADSICFYFDSLVDSIPLIKRGLSPFCSALFARTKKILRDGSARRRNATRVCKIATCLYDCGNRVFSQNWSGFKDLTVNDFVIEPVADEQEESEICAHALAAGGDDAVHSSGDSNDAALNLGLSGRPSVFKKSSDFREFIESLVQTRPFGLYHRILAHDGLDCTEWRTRIHAITRDARKAVEALPNAVTCVFVDEMNTANSLGLISEAFTNHSMGGEPLHPSYFSLAQLIH